jgi:hypothetical protein
MATEREAKGRVVSRRMVMAKGTAFAAATARKKSPRKVYRFVFRRYQARVEAKQARNSHAADSSQGAAVHRAENPLVPSCSRTRRYMDAVFIIISPV